MLYSVFFNGSEYQNLTWSDVTSFMRQNNCPKNTPVRGMMNPTWSTYAEEYGRYAALKAVGKSKNSFVISERPPYYIMWVSAHILTILTTLGGIVTGLALILQGSAMSSLYMFIFTVVSVFIFQFCRVVIEGIQQLLQK